MMFGTFAFLVLQALKRAETTTYERLTILDKNELARVGRANKK